MLTIPQRETVESKTIAAMEAERWRLRVYAVAFLVAFALYLLVHAIGRGATVWMPAGLAIATASFGIWSGQGRALRLGVTAAILIALVVPVLDHALVSAEPFAAVIARTAVWPQLLVTLIGSRVLAAEAELSFAQFWRQSDATSGAVAIHSTTGAVALGAFFTLAFYVAVPHLLPQAAAGRPSAIIASALQGSTIVHTAIIFLFFVILAAIVDAARLYWEDRAVLAAFRRVVARARQARAAPDFNSIIAHVLAHASHSRAARILADAIRTASGDAAVPLATLAIEGFRDAPRRFVRALLPFLPLLGFLGTVIGLAAAIAELPLGLAAGSGRDLDVSGSLAGLAIKFETTLLGLLASMISSLALNVVEKREAELSAECLRAVDLAFTGSPGAPDA